MDNGALRKQARHLYWKHRGLLWGLFLLFILIEFPCILVRHYLLQPGALSTIIGILNTIIIQPVVLFGNFHILLNILRGKQVKVSMLFDLYKHPYHPLKLYGVLAVLNIPYIVLTVLVYLQANNGFPTLGQSITLFIVYMSFAVLLCWFILRLFLMTVLVIDKPMESIWAQVKTSFILMKKNVRHLLWFLFTVILPAIAVYLLFFVVYFSTSLSDFLTQSSFPLLTVVLSGIGIFVFPYVSLASVAYANEMLQRLDAPNSSKNQRRKQARLNSKQAKPSTQGGANV